MARGLQKLQSQKKGQERNKKNHLKKSNDQHQEVAQKGLKTVCCWCKCQMTDLKTYKTHFETKHPKEPLPSELEIL